MEQSDLGLHFMGVSRGGGPEGGGVQTPTGITCGKRFASKFWYGHPSRSNWTHQVQLLLEGGPRMVLCEIYICDHEDPPAPEGIFSGSVHALFVPVCFVN